MDVDGVLNITSLLTDPDRVTHMDDEGNLTVRGVEAPVRMDRYRHYRIYWRTDLPPSWAAIMSEFELVWATTWEDEANDFWLPKMGLNEPLPFIVMPSFRRSAYACWKSAGVAEWLHETYNVSRRGVWADDEVSARDTPYIGSLEPLRVLDSTGLTFGHIDDARRLAGLAQG